MATQTVSIDAVDRNKGIGELPNIYGMGCLLSKIWIINHDIKLNVTNINSYLICSNNQQKVEEEKINYCLNRKAVYRKKKRRQK